MGRELNRLGIELPEINSGMIEFQAELTTEHLLQLKESVFKLGFEVVDTADNKLLDRISELIKELILENRVTQDFPAYLTEKLGVNYLDSMNLFMQVYGINLTHYIVLHQVERVKEILLYEDRTIKEIAAMLQYKNEAQLTRIFKETTGLTPGYYRKIKKNRLEVRKRTYEMKIMK